MRTLKKSPHDLVRNPHSYCFRVNVSKDLRRLVGRRELRYSLRTGFIGVARVKAQIISAQVHQLFSCLRKGGRKLELRDEQIQELVQQYLKQYIEGVENNSASYVQLCRGALRAQLKGIEVEKRQMSSGFADIPERNQQQN